MSATLHPNYPSMSKWLGERTTCDCGRCNVLKDDLRMDPLDPGTETCPDCRAEKKELADAFAPLIN